MLSCWRVTQFTTLAEPLCVSLLPVICICICAGLGMPQIHRNRLLVWRGSHPLLPRLEYDAIGLGNHDFDFGLDYLSSIASQHDAPVLPTNIANAQHLPIHPWTVLTREVLCDDGQMRMLRFGVLSVLPTQTLQWNHGQLADTLIIDPMVATATRASAQLKSARADIVILLAHSGLGGARDSVTSENSACTWVRSRM